MLRRLFATVLLGAGSLLCCSSANAWHHHHHHYHGGFGWGGYGWGGGYGYSSFYPGAYYGYSSPWYSSISINTGYWSSYRPFHHHRPYYSTIYSTSLYSPYYYSSYYPTYYSTPTYAVPSCQPVVTQSYYQPAYNVAPIYDCCSTVPSSGVIQSSGAAAPAPIVDPQLQIRNESKSQYMIADRAEWVDTAVELIDQMAASGGLTEAEEACDHLIAVRTNVPASIHLRAGLLALQNGKTFSVAATHFEHAASTQQLETTTAELSAEFTSALHLDQFAQWEPQVQKASKRLLGGPADSISKIRLTSDRSDSRMTATSPTIEPDNDAQVVLDAVLRVNGRSAMADQIAQAIERLPNL